MNKLVYNEDANLWVSIPIDSNMLALEEFEFPTLKVRNNSEFVKLILGFSLVLFLDVANVYANEGNPFKVYKNGKELPQFFTPNSPIPNNLPSTPGIPPFFLILFMLFSNFNQFEQNKVLENTLQINQKLQIQNYFLRKNLLISGGKIILGLSFGFYALSIILILRLARSDELKDKLKQFKSQQLGLFLFQIIILIGSILLEDIKNVPKIITGFQLQQKGKFFVENYLELLVTSLIISAILLFTLEYILLPFAIKSNPGLSEILEQYNFKFNELETDKNLSHWSKEIKKLELKALKDKAMIKIASTAELLERTYYKKLREGRLIEMRRIGGELPKIRKKSVSQLDSFSSRLFAKKELPPRIREKIKQEVFKPTYFYKMHQSYRIKQNLLAMTYFLAATLLFKEFEPTWFPKDFDNKPDNNGTDPL